MQIIIRVILAVVGVALVGLSVGFVSQQSWAMQMWPWPDKSLSYAFVAAMQAAIAAAVFWIAITGEVGVIAPGALNLMVMMSGVALYLGGEAWATREWMVVVYAVACGLFAFFNFWLFLWAYRISIRDPRPLPMMIRLSYILFIVALATVGTALVLQTPNVLPWEVEGPTSIVLGWMFLGDAFYFLYALFQPRWYGAAAQLWSFLAYDLVLIGPFLLRLPVVDPQYRPSLIVYTLVLLYSGVLAIYFFFFNRNTRIVAAAT